MKSWPTPLPHLHLASVKVEICLRFKSSLGSIHLVQQVTILSHHSNKTFLCLFFKTQSVFKYFSAHSSSLNSCVLFSGGRVSAFLVLAMSLSSEQPLRLGPQVVLEYERTGGELVPGSIVFDSFNTYCFCQ